MKVKDVQHGKTTRKSFARIEEILEMPNLIEVQKKSYEWFLAEGLREVFADAASITDYTGNLELSFLDYTMDEEPKYSIEECKARDATYATPLKVRMRLRNKETGEIKEQEIFMGDFPKMTDSATFIINGAERAIVSQLVRSPGVYYGKELDKTDKVLLSTTVIPYRGAWLEYETDANDIFYVRIDKNRKIPITSFIRAIGVKTDAEIKELFGEDPLLLATLDKDPAHSADEALIEIYKKMRPGEPPSVESATSLMDMMFFDMRRYDISAVGRYKYNKKLDIARRITGHKLLETVTDPMTGEVVAEADTMLTREKATEISARGINNVIVESADGNPVKVFGNGMVFVDDFKDYLGMTAEELGIKEKVRFTVLKEIIDSGVQGEELKKAFKARHYDLIPKTIIVDDMLASICYLLNLSHGIGTVDDIDHLGNRRLRCVGELLQNQVRIGFSRMERVIRERMTIQDLDVVTPQSLINIRPVTAAIKEFFGSSPLSQFMDQNNPLAELTHKRRMSALGPGGLSRDRASFEVRDVHYSHYGRLCPIETPEGPNIGLISYLATYARINDFGFIEAPYRVIEHIKDEATGEIRCHVTDEVRYMTADVEDEFIVCQATEPMDENNDLVNDRVTCRLREEFVEVDRKDVDLMDVSPRMMISVATAFIPFLDHDDANRALMGANMQRQAVPLLKTEAPIVATGMEYKAAVDSGTIPLAEGDGVVTRVTAREVNVHYDNGTDKSYHLTKFLRSNQSTCINMRPIVDLGERVKKGDVLADGPSTDQGEIALGKNALIVRLFICTRLGNFDFFLGIGTGDRRGFLDFYDIVDTEVFNDLIGIDEILYVEADDVKSHRSQVRFCIFFDQLRKLLTVGNHLFQTHLSNDLTHVSFKDFSCNLGNIFAVAVQEVLGCFLKLLRFVPDFDVDGCIHLNIDVVSGRHGVARLHINRYQLQTQLVQPLKEWELDAGFTDQDPLAFLETGNNKCGIRRRLHITARQNGKNDHHNSDHGNHGCMFEYKFHLVSSLFSADAFRSAFCFCVCVIFTIAFFAG